MTDSGLAQPIVSVSEAQAFIRLETGEEEALIAGMIRTASAICEAFLGQTVIARTFAEEMSASGQWQRLAVAPVRSIDEVSHDGTVLAAGAYEIDIDLNGDGWVRLTSGASGGKLRVSGQAGLASTPNGVPEPVRHGVLRLVGHLFAARDGDGTAIPAAVTALWRPYRRLRFS